MLDYATQQLNMQIFNYHFTPKLIPTLATMTLLPIMISLGNWQSNKAEKKQALQNVYDQREQSAQIQIGSENIDLETLRYHRVTARGYYEPNYQFLLDNQIYKGQAGYHIVTPLHIAGSKVRILVNRGWVPVGADRAVLPVIETPQGEVEVTGYAHDPSGKYLELAQVENKQQGWQMVWQNWDSHKYTREVPFSIHPIFILLDPTSSAGGYVREWPKPAARIEVNRGYALQWYLMSFALIIIYLVTNIKKISTNKIQVEDHINAK
jgi:surfeit locus 1 family protein